MKRAWKNNKMKEHLSSLNIKKKNQITYHRFLIWGDRLDLSYLQNSCSCNSHTCTFQYTSNPHSFYIYIYLLCSRFCNCRRLALLLFQVQEVMSSLQHHTSEPYSSGSGNDGSGKCADFHWRAVKCVWRIFSRNASYVGGILRDSHWFFEK